MESTSASLLERLRQPGQSDAWDRFARLYTPLLLGWAHQARYHLQPADAEDLVQTVLTDLVRKLPSFKYDPKRKFRGWLRGIFHNKWKDHCARVGRVPAGGMADLADLEANPGTDPGDADEQQLLMRRALNLMRSEFAEKTWKACYESVAKDRPAAEVAVELGISENAVFIARSRVLRRLRQEMTGLL